MYYFYMGSVLLPIPPEKLSLKINNKNSTMTLVSEGEVNCLKDAGLTDVEFDVLIPAVEYSFAKYDSGFKPAEYFLTHFEQLKTAKKPFQFIVTRKMPDGRLLFDTNLTVSLEDYTIKEDAKQGFDLMIQVNLKQYKAYGTKIVKVVNNTQATVTNKRPTDSKTTKFPTTYTVQKGDTLSGIAKKFYGDSSKWRIIYNANKDKIKDPNLIRTGWVLTIPDPNAASTSSTNKTSYRVLTVTFAGVKSYYGTVVVSYYQNGSKRTSTCSDSFKLNVDTGTKVTLQCRGANGHSYNVIGSGWDGGSTKSKKISSSQSVTIQWVR